jgi:protein phosphatase
MDVFCRSIVGASGINADQCLISEDMKVFAVADGASGAFDKVAAGEYCVRALQHANYSSSGMKPLQYLDSCFMAANNALIEKSQKDGKLSFGTLTMAIIDNGIVTVGAIGDTPIFLISNNKIMKVVKPRKRYALAIEYNQITEEDAEKAVSSLPGCMHSMFENYIPMVIPEIAKSQCKVNPGDTVIICSDGVSDWVTIDEFFKWFGDSRSVQDVCEDILKTVIERCGSSNMDDTTIVVAKV